MNSPRLLRAAMAMLPVLVAACSGPSVPTDAGPDVLASDAMTTDHAVTPVPYDAGPFSCGTVTCGANQVCYQPCSGIDAGRAIEPACVDVPDSCGGVPGCDCVHYSLCPATTSSGGAYPTCVQRDARTFACHGCA